MQVEISEFQVDVIFRVCVPLQLSSDFPVFPRVDIIL